MKSKDIAAQLIADGNAADATVKDVLGQVCHHAMQLAAEAMSNAAKRGSDASKIACLREGFTKWKSVVSQVLSAKPDAPIGNEFYPKAIGMLSTQVFALCMRENIFLGYTPDEKDLAKAAEGIQQAEAEMMRDRAKSLIMDARKMGMDPNIFIEQARAMGINID